MTIFSNLFGNSDNANQTSLDAVDANVDAVLVDTGTTIPGTLSAILADTNEVQGDVNTLVSRVPSTAASQSSVNTVDSLVDTLVSRLTSTRAGYLDNLNGLVASRLDANVSSVGGSSLTRHAEVNVSGSGTTINNGQYWDVSLGATFDAGKSLVQISQPSLYTDSPFSFWNEDLMPVYYWLNASTLRVGWMRQSNGSHSGAPDPSSTWKVTVLEFA